LVATCRTLRATPRHALAVLAEPTRLRRRADRLLGSPAAHDQWLTVVQADLQSRPSRSFFSALLGSTLGALAPHQQYLRGPQPRQRITGDARWPIPGPDRQRRASGGPSLTCLRRARY